jgi:cysteinyl-tRNA synthetase
MIDIISTLIERGHAYAAEGHVLFHVPSMKGYGKLSGRSLDEMVAGARVEVAPYKKDAMDFVLWKPSPADLPGWESPWGRGRPGWHIECSAMSAAHLGERFDIHGGGIDLIFPHHENEIAQSRCAFGTDVMATVWMHNGFLQVEGQKMSKSLGNFITIHELLADWPGEVLRLNMLRTHYRQPIDWTLKGLEESAKMLGGWFAGGPDVAAEFAPDVLAALRDDLNTPQAIAEMHQLADARSSLAAMGFKGDLTDPRASKVDRAQVETMIGQRIAARDARNWAESDRIRDALVAMGIQLKDSKDPRTGELVTTWEVKR